MAKKFMLVPSDQFQHMLSASTGGSMGGSGGLLSTKIASSAATTTTTTTKAARGGGADADDQVLAETAKRVRALLKKPAAGRKRGGKRKNTASSSSSVTASTSSNTKTSIRKALLDQELSRYLRQRRERADRPVKVQVVNKDGAQLLIDPMTKRRLLLDDSSRGGADAQTPSGTGDEAAVIEREEGAQLPLAATPGSGDAAALRELEDSIRPHSAAPPGRGEEKRRGETPTGRVSKRLEEGAERKRRRDSAREAAKKQLERVVWENRSQLGECKFTCVNLPQHHQPPPHMLQV